MRHSTLLLILSLWLASLTGSMAAERTIKVALNAPDGNWSVSISEVYQTDQELWVVAKLNRRPGFGISVITKVSDQVKLAAPELPVKVFVTGKRWGWNNSEPYEFVKNPAELQKKLKGKKRIHPPS